MEQNYAKRNVFSVEPSFSRVKLCREKGKVRQVPLWKHEMLDERIKRFARFLKRESSTPKRPLFYKQPNVILGCVHHPHIPGIPRESCHLNFSVTFSDQSTKIVFINNEMSMIFVRTIESEKTKLKLTERKHNLLLHT